MISIIIKCFNEEKTIGKCIESIIQACEGIENKIILVDSLSTDRSVEIASQYPITILQMTDDSFRAPSKSAQIGYMQAKGEYIFVIDADMIIHKDFIKKAIEYLSKHPSIQGISGIVKEVQAKNISSKELSQGEKVRIGKMLYLAGGGIYRKKILDLIGRIANPSLKCRMEEDLGLKITSRGYELERLNIPMANHYRDKLSDYQELFNRFTAGYWDGFGQIIRANFDNKKRLISVLKRRKRFLVYILFQSIIIFLIIYFALGHNFLFIFEVILFDILSWLTIYLIRKKGNFSRAFFSYIRLNVVTYALIRGFLLYKKQIITANDYRTIQE